MSSTIATFVIELANFLLLAALVGWLLFKPVRAALEARRADEARRRTELESRERTVTDGLAALDARRTALDAELTKDRQARLAAAEKEADAILAHARAAADRERDRIQRLVGHLDQAETERLAAAVATAARDAVARLLATLQAPDLDRALVRVACRQIRAGTAPVESLFVESAAPLDDDAKADLAAAAGPQATLQFRVVPDLGAGVRVTTAHGLIDASAAGIAAHTERMLSETLTRAAAERES